jgi:hypothetical protein
MPQETTAPNPELAPSGTPEGTQLGTTQQQPAVSAPATQTQPTVEELTRQLEETRQQAQSYEQRFKETQSAFTRSQQALAQLAGADPNARPADPLAPHVQKLTAQGYNEKDARAILSVAHDMMQPLQQQFEQSHRSLQSQSLVEDVMYQAASSPENQPLFTHPQVADQVRTGLRIYAQNGGQVTPEIAIDMAILAAYRMPKQGGQAQPQVTVSAQPTPQPFARGMFNFQPSVGAPPTGVAQASPLSAEAQQVENEIKQRYLQKPQ